MQWKCFWIPFGGGLHLDSHTNKPCKPLVSNKRRLSRCFQITTRKHRGKRRDLNVFVHYTCHRAAADEQGHSTPCLSNHLQCLRASRVCPLCSSPGRMRAQSIFDGSCKEQIVRLLTLKVGNEMGQFSK